MSEYTVLTYTENGRDIFGDWFAELRDLKGKDEIRRTLRKISQGNLGNTRYCREGVWEIKIDVSAGYRVYYSQSGKKIILLLCGGSKRTQKSDIDRAVNYLKKFKEEHKW